MTRDQVLAYITTEFKDLLTNTKIPVADGPTAFQFVIDDAFAWGGTDDVQIKACVGFFALRRFEAAILNDGGALPKTFSERMSKARELCAKYPFAQE